MAVDDDDDLDLAELDTSVVQAGAWDPDEDPVGSPSLKAPEWMEWGEGRTPRDSGTCGIPDHRRPIFRPTWGKPT